MIRGGEELLERVQEEYIEIYYLSGDYFMEAVKIRAQEAVLSLLVY